MKVRKSNSNDGIMKKVLFLHGLESKPGGIKPQFLKKNGYHVLNPALPKSSFEESIRIAQHQVDTEAPDIIVGSSRGGAIAMCIEPRGANIVLIAPAFKRYARSAEESITGKNMILHSKFDDIIDYEDSVHLARRCCAELMVVGACHRMSDDEALEGMLDAVRWVSK